MDVCYIIKKNKMGILTFLYLLSITVLHIPEVKSSKISITTNIGSLNGKSENVEFNGHTKSVSQFLGIPFAKAPVGERRFLRPEAYGTLESPYNATFFRPHCMQSAVANPPIRYFQMSEDCLHLNVFIPGKTVSSDKKYAVMIFIHGGGFSISGSEVFSGDKLSAFHNVIVVTVNYRLNTFGFLSNGTKSSGNLGLWDQKLALQWVHDNIAAFGGDPGKVTLFGNSAGAASVLYHVMNPTNKGLFQRIITQSGSVLAQWAQQYNPAEMFKEFISEVKCDMKRYDDILVCLQSKDAADLVTNRFRPVVDNAYIMENPVATFSKQGNDRSAYLEFFSEVDFLSGVQSKEGAGVITKIAEQYKGFGIDIAKGISRSIFENQFVPSMLLQMYGASASPVLKEAVIQQYIDWSRPDDAELIRGRIIDFWSDVSFFVPAINVLKKHHTLRKNNGTSYFYVFDQKPLLDPTPLWLKGSKHAMELPYVFGLPDAMKIASGLPLDSKVTIPPADMKVSGIVMRLWTNFAKTGNPNLPVENDVKGVPSWPQYDVNSQAYLEFSSNMTSKSVKNYFAASSVEFWTNLVPLLEKCKTCGNQNCSGSQRASKAHSITNNTPVALLCVLFVQMLVFIKTLV
ncbi:cholinesterase 1-like [Ruditapes philippinarum]|uniref:cholinesterase 1-like n=1 Tax=Ruditapes philippinarum TaxID=129788 RepID=UPI00295C2E22|nr:cholinesterase 1-like [Ruditapes philippinarum]